MTLNEDDQARQKLGRTGGSIMRKSMMMAGLLGTILLAACSPQQQTSHDGAADAATVQAPTEGNAALEAADLARQLADSADDPAQITDTLIALDAAVVRASDGLSDEARRSVKGDLQSAKDAAALKDWSAVKEAASSIAVTLS